MAAAVLVKINVIKDGHLIWTDEAVNFSISKLRISIRNYIYQDRHVYKSSRELIVQAQFSSLMEYVECLECMKSLVTKVTQRVFCLQASL